MMDRQLMSLVANTQTNDRARNEELIFGKVFASHGDWEFFVDVRIAELTACKICHGFRRNGMVVDARRQSVKLQFGFATASLRYARYDAFQFLVNLLAHALIERTDRPAHRHRTRNDVRSLVGARIE